MSIPKITDYDIQDKLGSGTYATVYKARHKKNQSYHAIKIVEMASLSKMARDNLVTEIKLLKALSHKYIVGLDDFFWDDKNIYIVLEYCNAASLSAYIKQRKILPEATCRYFLAQLALAMQYMRSHDVCHFDLKPQNLLLTMRPNVILKVADFGFAQHLKLGEKNYTLKGSPLYMAPEVVLHRNYDARADLWSIGTILFECLFGKAPYSSKTVDELILKIKNQEKIVMPPRTKISPECKDLLTRLLQHDPSKRITFQEFFDHPFLDLKSIPTEKSLEKAIETVSKAVEEDERKNFETAYNLYCKALQQFIPCMTEESDAARRAALRSRIIAYLNRAEEIKTATLGKTSLEISPSQRRRSNLMFALEPSPPLKKLISISQTSPALKNALEIGRQGELYLYEKNIEAALDSFKDALSVLVPALNDEPPGDRRTLLHEQIKKWMGEAECLKTLLNAKHIDDAIPTHNCHLQ